MNFGTFVPCHTYILFKLLFLLFEEVTFYVLFPASVSCPQMVCVIFLQARCSLQLHQYRDTLKYCKTGMVVVYMHQT